MANRKRRGGIEFFKKLELQPCTGLKIRVASVR